MRLSDLGKVGNIDVVNDGVFDSLGLIGDTSERMLVFLQDRRYLPKIKRNANISCVITSEELIPDLDEGIGICASPRPQRFFVEVHEWLIENSSFYGVSFPTEIAQNAIVHASAYVSENNVRIGSGTIIGPNVTVLERTIIDDNVIVQAGATIGTCGFEFKRFDKTIIKVSHAGGVRLGNRVEIQANCAISRGIFSGWTELGDDTKLDNLVHVAHNVAIGDRCLIAASATIAGSVTIGDDVWIGPGSCISSEVSIADNAKVSLGAVVINDVGAGERVSGNFAVPHKKFAKFIAAMRRR